MPVDWKHVAHHTFEKVSPLPHGHDHPFFAQSVTYEFPGFTAIVMHPWTDHSSGKSHQEVLHVGDAGLEWFRSVDERDDGSGPTKTCPIVANNIPSDGWRVSYARCDQTGGMTMVDVLVFENGWCLTLTDECAVLQDSIVHWDYRGEDVPWVDENACAEILTIDDGGVA